jgi:hypothetical protein
MNIDSKKDINCWIHRISHLANVSYPLLGRGYLSIGWSNVSDEAFLRRVSAHDRGYFQERIDDNYEKGRPGNINRHCLWDFISEMGKGDLVVVPFPVKIRLRTESGTFSVYKITADDSMLISSINLAAGLSDWDGRMILLDGQKKLIFEGETDVIDLGFARKVEPIEVEIPRYGGYADERLTKNMRWPRATLKISSSKDSIDRAVYSFRQRRNILSSER